ncbi:twitching motility protein, partial [Actinotalea fermentans ATCC 43279 = JCM 9966 = DSM 3133]
ARPAAPPAAEAPQAARKPAAAASTRRLGMGDGPGENDLNLDETLRAMIAVGASDLHITSGAPPTVRIDGRLLPLEGHPSLMPDQIQRTLYSVLTQRQREQFETDLELDFAYAVRGVARFRVNLYQQRDALGAAFRVIPYEIKPLEALGVPPVVGNFANLPRGLVLVTGPTGSGKSTTLASIIDLANRTRTDHIMTVEDPIEFLHRHKKSLINQREVGADTLSFANALKHVLRQDPDIILVGEMRDLETISVALTAAETGHLVFATLHTQDAAQTIDRIIDVFPSHQQAQVRTQLAGAIQGVVCQALCKRADGPGRAVATEVMIATPAIRNLIREGKTHQIYSAMQAGAKQGMHTMDQHLAELVKAGRITYEQGLEKCHHVADYNRLTGRTGSGGGGGSSLGAMSGGLGDPMSMGSSGGQMPGASETYGGQG